MSDATFTTVSWPKKGYDRDEVDEFFDHARAAYETGVATINSTDISSVSFDLVRKGYLTSEVDSALDRLEAIFVARARQEFIAANGQDAWNAALAARAQTLYPRLARPSGKRFSPATGQGYAQGAVDKLCDRIVAYFDTGAPITSADIRAAQFPPARGANAYSEASVDAFLARAVEVLLGVE